MYLNANEYSTGMHSVRVVLFVIDDEFPEIACTWDRIFLHFLSSLDRYSAFIILKQLSSVILNYNHIDIHDKDRVIS